MATTGHGVRGSVRDKGLLWVFNQSMRVGAHARLHQEVARTSSGAMQVLVLEPEPTDVLLFLHNPVNVDARRAILEYAVGRERAARFGTYPSSRTTASTAARASGPTRWSPFMTRDAVARETRATLATCSSVTPLVPARRFTAVRALSRS